MDLTNLTFVQLRELQAEITETIKDREKEELAKARQQILAIAQGAGVSLHELMGSPKARIKKTVAIRYQHPTDASLHWTGRGRKPMWVEEWISAGHKLSGIDVTTTKG